MVYYSPYKQIWRAFIRAVRVFISSLFSKRLLLMIIVALVIMLLHLNVHAESISQENYIQREVIYEGYDENTDNYNYSYKIYLQNGLNEGTLSIPSSLHNRSNWFICLRGDVYTPILIFSGNNANTFYIKQYDTYCRWSFDLDLNYAKNFYMYRYTNGAWVVGDNNISQSSNRGYNLIQPNSIIISKDMYIQYVKDSNTYYPYTLLRATPKLSRTSMKLTSQGLRLYVGDFYSRTYDLDSILSDYVLSRIEFKLKEENSFEYLYNDQDLLSYDDLQEDENGKYYIDIKFSDYLLNLNNSDGTYIITVKPFLSVTEHIKAYGTFDKFDYTSIFTTEDYCKYIYYSNYGQGILVAIDENGNEIDINGGGENGNSGDNIDENQTATAIYNMTNSINDMSDFMQDDNFSSDSITNNMPSSDEFQDVTESGFDNIFTTLRNAFTSDNYQDVEFEVPFSNGQKITIPSNLTENIIPTAIKTLIQMVYWYFIARFIVKDIAGYIEKAKSGDIFSSSDTNIKTDML